MGADSFAGVLAVAEYVGIGLDDEQHDQLRKFHVWLGSESIRAGGLGPDEKPRLWDRHIGDSLVFSLALSGATSCVDLGSGTGLPGIPLAIAHPDIDFTLVDRSGRRCDLMRRAVAVLDLPNCVVQQQDIAAIAETFGSVVSRAAIPPERILIHVKRILEPGATALIGLSRTSDSHTLPALDDLGMRLSLVSIPPRILDSGASLLRIEAT